MKSPWMVGPEREMMVPYAAAKKGGCSRAEDDADDVVVGESINSGMPNQRGRRSEAYRQLKKAKP